VGRGSWVECRGSWVKSRGSWVKSRGSREKSRGSREKSRGSRIRSRGSRESRGFQAKYFHIFTFLPLECVFFSSEAFPNYAQIYIVLERVKAGFLISADRFINIITKCG
jgi:hypothetical protein